MEPAEYRQRTQPLGFNEVAFSDHDLNRNYNSALFGPNKVIRVTTNGHGIERTPSGTSQVWAELRNHTDHNLMLEARTRFYSLTGRPMPHAPAWQRIALAANAVALYETQSVSTEPLQYRIEVRQAQ